MASDRRVLVVALLAMVGLVLVGVGSAAVFTRSACERLAPADVATRTAGDDLDDTLAAALPNLDNAASSAAADAITDAAGQLGPLSGIADVRGATALTPMLAPAVNPAAADSQTDTATEPDIVDEPGEIEAVGAVGTTTTVLDAAGREVIATAEVGDEATLTGDGSTLYSLALTNQLTGQVDALLPLHGDLTEGTCVDTATVATPLAFYLDAAAGELLLYRADEDGDDPVLELRDPVAGRVWAADVELGTAPPGVMGERLDARLGDEVVVLGRRSSADDDPELPVVTAIDRLDGQVLWTLDRTALPDQVLTSDASWVDVLAVGDVAVLLVTDVAEDDDATSEPAEDPARGGLARTAPDRDRPGRLVVVDPFDGTVLAASPEPLEEVLGAVTASDGSTAVIEAVGDGWVATDALVRAAGDNGEALVQGPGRPVAVAQLADDRWVALRDVGMDVIGGDAADALAWPFVAKDVLVHDGFITLLLGADDGDAAVAVTFES